ncbi:MAG: signal peptidase II [Eubacteriales bacterium]|nr:signal peptidase II [Eubacteriales bacterium]
MRLIVLGLVLISLDQISKWAARAYLQNQDAFVVIEDFFSFRYVENRGAAWGMLNNKTWGPWILTIVALALTIFLLYRMRYLHSPALRVFLTLIISGSIGNLIDRFVFGYVTDFISFRFGSYYFPVFNLADSFITVGVALTIIYILFINKAALNEIWEMLDVKDAQS